MGKLWRTAGTVLCFVIYATLAWLAGLTLLPVLRRWPGTTEQRRCRIRRLVGTSFRWLLKIIAWLRLGRVEIEGREWLDAAQGKLIVATHPMYLDVVALISLLPLADCVIKKAMWHHPFYRRFVKVLGHISNADTLGLMNDCIHSLEQGRTLILFPEGTRSTPGRPLRFRRGAAQVAIRSGCDVVPVMIHCDPPTLGKAGAWHEVANRPWRLSIKFFPPQSVLTLGAGRDLPHGVAARRVTHAMETFLKHEMETHEYTDRRIEAAHHRLA